MQANVYGTSGGVETSATASMQAWGRWGPGHPVT